MSSQTRRLTEYIVGTHFDDIPGDVIEKTKEVILDTVGCTFGGYQTEIGVLSVKYVRSLGGKGQSTVIGSGDMTSALNAAYANGRMANALDADETSSLPSHHASSVLGAALACCELVGGSGTDLVTSFLLGYDMGVRATLSVKPFSKRPSGSLTSIFGSVIAAGKALNLDQDQMAHALGMAIANMPVNAMSKFSEYVDIPIFKYGDTGWSSLVAVNAALSARVGMKGFDTMLDGDVGFWSLSGASDYDRKQIFEPEDGWHIRETTYKPWPSCRFTHTPATGFERIMLENNLRAEEIEGVTVHVAKLKGGANRQAFSNQEPKSMVSSQFCHPHVIAMIALGIRPGPEWQSPEIINDPKVRAFRKKVTVVHDESLKVRIEGGKRRGRPAKVEVVADGKKYVTTLDVAKGDPATPETTMTHQEIKDKFKIMSSGIAISSASWITRIDEMIDLMDNLERLERIDELTSKFSPF